MSLKILLRAQRPGVDHLATGDCAIASGARWWVLSAPYRAFSPLRGQHRDQTKRPAHRRHRQLTIDGDQYRSALNLVSQIFVVNAASPARTQRDVRAVCPGACFSTGWGAAAQCSTKGDRPCFRDFQSRQQTDGNYRTNGKRPLRHDTGGGVALPASVAAVGFPDPADARRRTGRRGKTHNRRHVPHVAPAAA